MMLARDIRTAVHQLHAIGRNHTDLLSFLLRLGERFTQLAGHVGTARTAPDDPVSQLIASAREEARSKSPGEVYRRLHAFGTDLAGVQARFPDVLNLSLLTRALNAFEEAYDAFLPSGNSPTTVRVTAAADQVHSAFATLLRVTAPIEQHLELELASVPNDTGTAAFYFPSQQTVREVAAKLDAIDRMYVEVAGVQGVDVEVSPLRVRHIEAGSLLVEIIGHEAVIGALASLVTAAVVALHRQFRRSGRIQRGTAQLEALLGVRQIMVEQGLLSARADAELEDTFLRLARELNRLVGGEPVVKVNDEVLSLPEDLHTAYLESGRKLLLNPGEQPTGEE